MPSPLHIGNASAFWGDSNEAPVELLRQARDLDVLTLDYLAEVSMSILARQRERDPTRGFARDFVDVIRSLTPIWREGRRFRLVTNAGGLNPFGCAEACAVELRNGGCRNLKIGVVSGDDVLPAIKRAFERDPNTTDFCHLENGQRVGPIIDTLVTANAYMGAEPVAEAINRGADIVITGRLADPSLAVGPCMSHFKWAADDYSRIAGATVAGHLIECGTQVTGGASTDWLKIPDPANIGFPIVEVADDGSCTVTKPPGTGGMVNERTVKEQLLYEIGDPAAYLSPDATVSFLTLRVDDRGGNRVRVSGASGSTPPTRYKVSATYRAGYRASGMLTIFGRDAVEKAERCGQIVIDRLAREGKSPKRLNVECLGAGAVVGMSGVPQEQLLETVLRLTAYDERRDVIERFTRELTPLVTAGPQGTTGYFEGRPSVREVFGYWPTLISRSQVMANVQLMEV